MTYVIYGRENCNWCVRAKNFLEQREEEYRYIDINDDPRTKAFIVSKGFKTVPQIFEDTKHIGGYKELVGHFGEGNYGDNA
jgi:glutaredoxin